MNIPADATLYGSPPGFFSQGRRLGLIARCPLEVGSWHRSWRAGLEPVPGFSGPFFRACRPP